MQISGDAIVGFPGETEEQFQRTVELVEALGFDRVNTAAYSPRPGTPAAAWDSQVCLPVIGWAPVQRPPVHSKQAGLVFGSCPTAVHTGSRPGPACRAQTSQGRSGQLNPLAARAKAPSIRCPSSQVADLIKADRPSPGLGESSTPRLCSAPARRLACPWHDVVCRWRTWSRPTASTA